MEDVVDKSTLRHLAQEDIKDLVQAGQIIKQFIVEDVVNKSILHLHRRLAQADIKESVQEEVVQITKLSTVEDAVDKSTLRLHHHLAQEDIRDLAQGGQIMK